MKEVINIQETTREKKQYVRPQITMIPMQAEHALLAASLSLIHISEPTRPY